MIFGDIDDFWDPKRVEVVYNTISESLDKDVFVIQISGKYEPKENNRFYRERTELDGMKKGDYEYWMTIIKFSIFAKFFKEVDERYLKLTWCDLAFVSFMHRGNLTGSHTWHLEDSKAEELISNEIYMYEHTGSGSEREGGGNHYKDTARIFLSRRLCEVCPEKLDPSELELDREYNNGYYSDFKFNLKRPFSIDDIEKIENNINELDDMITVGDTSTNSVEDEAANITWIQTNDDLEVKFRFNAVVARGQIKVKIKANRLAVIVPEGVVSVDSFIS